MHYSLITDQISRIGLSEPLATEFETFPAENPDTTGHPKVFDIRLAKCSFESFESTSRVTVQGRLIQRYLFRRIKRGLH